MKIRPCTLKEAKDFIQEVHRHHIPPVGHKFSIKAVDDQGQTIGVAVGGRPSARMLDNGTTCEVTRLATNGSENACSMLYGAMARVAKAMGYDRIITYILETESGVSLKASGWVLDDVKSSGGSLSRPSRGRVDKAPTMPKKRYSRLLAGPK